MQCRWGSWLSCCRWSTRARCARCSSSSRGARLLSRRRPRRRWGWSSRCDRRGRARRWSGWCGWGGIRASGTPGCWTGASCQSPQSQGSGKGTKHIGIEVTEVTEVSKVSTFIQRRQKSFALSVETDPFFLQSSRIRVDLQSYESKPTDKWGQYNLRAEKNWTGSSVYIERGQGKAFITI